MKKTIAVFQSLKYDWLSDVCTNESSRNKDSEWIRITEFVEVDFPDLEIDYNAAQVKAVEAEIEKVRDEAMKTIGMLEQKKQELLALTHEEAE